MINNKDKTKSKKVKDALKEYNSLAETLKENTQTAVKDLLSETVRDEYAKILNESDDADDFDEDEVEDTSASTVSNESDNDDDTDGGDGIAESDSDIEDDTDDVDDAAALDNEEGEDDTDGEDGSEWEDFDKYKVGENEYDLTKAEDEDIVKVYKLLNDDDQVVIHKDNDKVNIKDNEAGTEYIIDLGGKDDAEIDDDEENLLNDDEDNMNESKENLYELVLNEESNLGYTDNYQGKNAMDLKNLKVADEKDASDWGSKGLRSRGDEKPWSGIKGKKQKVSAPFDKEASAGDDTIIEVALDEIHSTTENGPVRRGTSMTAASSSGKNRWIGRNLRTAKGGQTKGTGVAAYSGEDESEAELEKVVKENKQLKKNMKTLCGYLNDFKGTLKEAAVVNLNLGQIIKLLSENTTSKDEKKEIIARFGKEAKSVEQSKQLYESISRELKKAGKMNITESAPISADSSKKINEKTIYQSNDMLKTLDLMHRVQRSF